VNRLSVHLPPLWVIILILSLPWGIPVRAQAPLQITFDADEIGSFPSRWESRDGKAKDVYTVRTEGSNKFLHADARAVAIQIGYESKWSLRDFPVLTWKWRAVLFPTNSDERKKDGDDSVLSVYVVFGRWPFIKSIKYIWSDTLPVGSSFNSPFSKSAKLVVVRSGRASMGAWLTETRDVLADYRQVFPDGDDSPVAEGIAVMTDSDNTNSRAIGDYADFQVVPAVSKRPGGS
jgi:hypothetical protein